MKDRIQQLIAQGRTEDALDILAQQSSDAMLLQARYNNGKKQYNMGLIEFSEWQRTQAQINYLALQMCSTHLNVNVTINFNSSDSFKQSLEKMPLPQLVEQVTNELKGKPAMKAWLPLKQEYDSYEMYGNPFPPNYLTDLKSKLVTIYDEYYTNAVEAKKQKVKTAVQAIYDSIVKGKTEDIIRNAIDDLKIFFYENPNFVGLRHMNEYETELNSEKMSLYKQRRPETYISELEQIHSKLVECLNNILRHVEK